MADKTYFETRPGDVSVVKFCPRCAQPLGQRGIDGKERLACGAGGCTYVHWDNPVPVVAGLIGLGDRFVLARNVSWPAGLFSVISGFLERDESPEESLFREVQEELGLSATSSEFIGHYALAEPNQLILAYFVRAQGEIATGDEIAEVKLIGRDELERFDFGPLVLTAKMVADWKRQGTAEVRAPSWHKG